MESFNNDDEAMAGSLSASGVLSSLSMQPQFLLTGSVDSPVVCDSR
jgi:hypothetical protein